MKTGNRNRRRHLYSVLVKIVHVRFGFVSLFIDFVHYLVSFGQRACLIFVFAAGRVSHELCR